jgi:hypothetical protein
LYFCFVLQLHVFIQVTLLFCSILNVRFNWSLGSKYFRAQDLQGRQD